MDIFILSSGRANKQTTWASLPKEVQARTKIVVPYDEREAYKAFPLFTHPNIIRDVTATRQFLIERCPGKICMLDDDLTFATRAKSNPTLFHNASGAAVVQLFDVIKDSLALFAHVGVSGREGANRRIEPNLSVGRMVRILSYDCNVLNKHGIRYDRLKFMADFDVTLQLLRLGYVNWIINWIVQNQQGGSNSPGGCSQYRTPEAQTLDAFKLRMLHPDYVKLKTVQTKSAWAGMKERTDVTVQWKKAYAEGGARYGSR